MGGTRKKTQTKKRNVKAAHEDVDALVAVRVRAARLRAGLSKARLAERLGVSADQISLYEEGRSEIGAGVLVRLAAALDVNVIDLLPAQDEPRVRDDGGDLPLLVARLSEEGKVLLARVARVFLHEPALRQPRPR